ncbi:uncharacterized protein TM35_000141340 [Trypanosoma theileri]|uniref:Uncharacterized protein n=1 Tax=Trypanosoma theileri TaxID=67003 RepID=A0A1X0NWS1_9TRYP|nr:uncharacterized protein TM35_000141340 [Trypanosoma theileri]ORC88923.1 hypothetical protein TM35_000141340 [Trypanosoma theileri]
MFPLATHESPVRWNTMLHDLLHSLGLAPTPAVEASLNTLTSYAESPLGLYSDASSGVRDAKAYTALLLALHNATASWPAALRDALTPSVVHVGKNVVPVCGPAMEIFVVLYNAAVSNCNAGCEAMARARVEQACSPPRRISGSSSPTTTPSASSKAAYKSFTAAAELALCAEQALAGESDKLLSASDRHLVRQNFDFRALHEYAQLCAALAKYVYSTTSGAVSKKHDTLGKLAHEVSVLRVPTSLSSDSMQMLPTLLLAAYHRHRAEHYNRAAKVPDMSLVLGHIAYAWRLVDEVQQHCIEKMKSSSSSKNKQQRNGWQLLGRLSATLIGGGGGGAETGGKWGRNNNDEDDQPEPFAKLTEFLQESDLIKIFPLVEVLISDIAKLHEKYQHENSVIYFTRPASEEDVIADTPEAAEALSGYTTPSEIVSLAVKINADLNTFGELPTAEMLREVQQEQGKTREMREEAQRRLDQVQQLVKKIKSVLRMPPEVKLKLQKLEKQLHHKGDFTFDALAVYMDETHDKVKQVMENHEDVSSDLYRAKCEYIGEYVAPFKITAELQERERLWRTKADAARDGAAKFLLHRRDLALCDALLLPLPVELRESLPQAESAAAQAKEVLASNTSTRSEITSILSLLKKVQDACTAAMDETPPHWEHVEQALQDLETVIVDARELTRDVESETKRMEREKSRIVVTPLRRLHDVQFETNGQTGNVRGRRGTSAKATSTATVSQKTTEKVTRRGRKRSPSLGEVKKLLKLEESEKDESEEENKGITVPRKTRGASRAKKTATIPEITSTKELPVAYVAPILRRRIMERLESSDSSESSRENSVEKGRRQRKPCR